ncbi:MAG: HAD family hydrolase [Rhodobacteraceae bacterium]|nr:HAD family hydrolase [Paracoccaceae bacterium]
MAEHVTCIAFDADDTLWHNERFFKLTQARFAELLAPYAPGHDLDARLMAAERRNIGHYGFGIKGFVLSMIETALEVTDNAVPGAVIAELLEVGQDMLRHPVELLPHARAAVEAAKRRGMVMMITKGDLLHQEQKLAQSGLGELFDAVEIVSDKTPEVYAQIFKTRGIAPEAAVMVGNSVKSDILPPLACGAWAAHVPHDLEWDFEKADVPADHPRFTAMAHLGDLVDALRDG